MVTEKSNSNVSNSESFAKTIGPSEHSFGGKSVAGVPQLRKFVQGGT